MGCSSRGASKAGRKGQIDGRLSTFADRYVSSIHEPYIEAHSPWSEDS